MRNFIVLMSLAMAFSLSAECQVSTFVKGQIVLANYFGLIRKAQVTDVANGLVQTSSSELYLTFANIQPYRHSDSLRLHSSEILVIGETVLADYGGLVEKGQVVDIANGMIRTSCTDTYLDPANIVVYRAQ